MTVFRTLWRQAAAGLFLLLAGASMVGCGGKNSGSKTPTDTYHVTGLVGYVRPPLVKDDLGVPTGLETDSTKFKTLPARGVAVRLWELTNEKQADGSPVYIVSYVAITNLAGGYSIPVQAGRSYFIEILSKVTTGVSGVPIRLVADSIDSSLPVMDRNVYVMRKGLDGSTDSMTPATPAKETTLNFTVGVADSWRLAPESVTTDARADLEPAPTGSRVLALLDSAYTFSTLYGGAATAAPLDLHYLQGVNHPKGSFVEYDPMTRPLTYDGSSGKRHFFGSIRGDQASNDDAFDEGVLFPIFARNVLSTYASSLAPVASPLPDLAPDLAVLEAFADAMSANLLKSPYLADTSASGTTYRDVRDLLGLTTPQCSPFSTPSLRALSWDLILKGNSLPNPGTATDWDKIDPRAMQRFLIPRIPTDTSGVLTDVINIYSQVARLKDPKSGSESVDLASLFTDSVLTPILSPYNLTWPRPVAPSPYASFLQDWGADPANTVPAKTPPQQSFTMSGASLVDGVFPNASSGEVVYAKFTISKDTAFNLSLSLPSPLPPGATIEVRLVGQTLIFDGTNTPVRIVLAGNITTPQLYTVRMRLLSPTTLQSNPIQAALRFDPAP